ncbi:MAG: hypothetical protein ACRENF_02310 [Thermodesulfobacteriota bacterium]
MESYVCAVKDKRGKIEESMLAVLFLSALCLAGADFANYGFFIFAKVVSITLFLMICSLWLRQPIIPYMYRRRIREVLTQDSPGYSTENQEFLKLTVDDELSKVTVNVPFPSAPRVIPRRRRRRIYRHTRSTDLEQLSLW